MSSAAKNTRVRYGPLPELPVAVAIPFANAREDAPTPAQAIVAAMNSAAWVAVMTPELERRESERQARKKVKPAYTCCELESVFLYQLVCGFDTVRQTREHLTSHAGAEARRLLGFDRPRQTKGQVTRLHEVPSEATLSRYRLSWAPPSRPSRATESGCPTLYDLKKGEVERQKAAIAARAAIYERLLEHWLTEYGKTPEAEEASRAFFVDGTTLHSSFTCLVTEKKQPMNEYPRSLKRCAVQPVLDRPRAEGGSVVWDGRMGEEQWEALKHQDSSFRRYWRYSAEGGYLARSAGENRYGHGWSIINIVDSAGMPIDFQVGPIQAPEAERAADLFDRFGSRLASFPACEGFRVVAADAGFRDGKLASAVRRHGMLESVPLVSGSNDQRYSAFRNEHLPIRYKAQGATLPNEDWFTDGFTNLRCRCGQGEVNKKFFNLEDGTLVPRVNGRCRTCGPISITSGDWRKSGNRWVRAVGAADKRALEMGNPLTQTNPIAEAYTRRRFAVHEGVHSILTTRFGLIRGNRRIKYTDEVRLRTAATFSLLHAIAHEQRARAASRSQVQSPATPQSEAA